MAYKRHVHLSLDRLKDTELAYLDACARVRDVSLHALLRRLIHAVAADKMINAVLDDADHLSGPRRRGEYPYRDKTKEHPRPAVSGQKRRD